MPSSAGRSRRTALRVLFALLLVTVAVAAVVVVRDVRATPDPPAASGSTAVRTTTAPATTTAPSPTPDPTPTPTPTPTEPAFDTGQLSIDDPASSWVVVDKARPLAPLDFAPADLVAIGGRQLRAEAAQAMQDMFAAAAAEGLRLSVQSAYRSYDYQVNTFRNQVARPGYSEHQTGLAADIGGGGCDIESCFASTAEGRWVAANGYRFGYVIRYPEGLQEVTGYKYEPWHVRYVGVALATEMQRTGVPTLEQFFGLPPAPGYTS